MPKRFTPVEMKPFKDPTLRFGMRPTLHLPVYTVFA